MIASINPFSGVPSKVFEPLSDGELANRLERSPVAFSSHRHTPFSERRAKLLRAANILESET